MSLYQKQQQKKSSERKHDFLLTFFNKPHKLEHKEVNGYILQSYFSNATKRWEVMIFTQDSWLSSQRFVNLNHPEKLKDPVKQTKFRNLFNELKKDVSD